MFHQSSLTPQIVYLVSLLLLFPIQSFASPPKTDDWPLYSYDYNNSNYNASENIISSNNAKYLRRAWETFNDDSLSNVPPPSGFILESALGLVFPNAVVGVVASPILRDGTLYYVDALGTVFARDARTGKIIDANKHWTRSLVDPDYQNTATPVLPELVYTAPIVTDSYVWVLGSAYGQLHLLDRNSGAEIDFDPTTPDIDPYRLVADLPFSSILGDAVIVDADNRQLLIVSINVILNDALVQGEEGGLQIALDISNPTQPIEVWRRSTLEVDPSSGLRFGSGVSAGSGLAVDFKRQLIFGGTGQNTSAPYPDYPNVPAPAGYIDRSDSLYAIDFNSGEFVWTNQFFTGDVFNLNAPVSTGPNRPDGPRDADVLSPPVLFSAKVAGKMRDLVGNGSKGGLFKVVDRDNGDTVWQRQISKATGIGGIQAGAAVAGNVIYVAGFEGIDDGFSDAQFGISLETGLFPNAFFATFSPAFWANVEDVSDDSNPATGMRIKVYALDAASGESKWHFSNNDDFVNLAAGAALRHVSVANGLLYLTTSSGQLFVLDASDGKTLFHDQSIDLNEYFSLGLGKPHHASMNGGSIISQGMVYVPYGAQNNPSGGLIAYALNEKPIAQRDQAKIWRAQETVRIDALQNDLDPNGDKLRFTQVAGFEINPDDGKADVITLPFGQLQVVNPGDDPSDVGAAYLLFTPTDGFQHSEKIDYQIVDIAPFKIVNGIETNQAETTHSPRMDAATITLTKMW